MKELSQKESLSITGGYFPPTEEQLGGTVGKIESY